MTRSHSEARGKPITAAPSLPSESEPGEVQEHEQNQCANCEAPLQATYCGVCGQRAANCIVPLWQVTNEFLEDLWDLDLRILRTFPTFFFRPGQLTVEYVGGRRRRYIRPLRLYLFSSFLLFTVLAFTNLSGFSFSFGPTTAQSQAEVAAARAELEAARVELARQFAPAGSGAEPGVAASVFPDSTHRQQVAASVEQGMKSVDEALAALSPAPATSQQNEAIPAGPSLALAGAVQELADGPAPLQPKVDRILRDPGALADDLIDRAPYLMFLLVPTFALLLKGLYLRRKRLYLEHLIFALHVHALAFIAFAASAGIGALGWGTSVHLDWWMGVVPFGYLFFALRRVYGQSPGVTILKAAVLLGAYGIILVAALVVLVVATVAFV